MLTYSFAETFAATQSWASAELLMDLGGAHCQSCLDNADYRMDFEEASDALDLALFMAVTDCPDKIIKQYM